MTLPYFDFCSIDDWWGKPASMGPSRSSWDSVAVIGQIVIFFFKNICRVKHYWCCKLPVQSRREKWKGNTWCSNNEDHEVFGLGCEPLNNILNVFLCSDNLRADTMPFSHHSHICGYVSVFPPRSGLDNWGQLQLRSGGRGCSLTLAHMMFFVFSQTGHSTYVSLLHYGMK